MDKQKKMDQLLASMASILDDAMEDMDVDFHYVIVTSYTTSEDENANHFMANVKDTPLERLLLGAIKALATTELTVYKKGYHVN